MFLVFFVIDATYMCRRLVQMIGNCTQQWDDATLTRIVPEIQADRNGRCELATIRVIAKMTHEVNKLLIYPFNALLLLILARHRVFDAWDMPLLR